MTVPASAADTTRPFRLRALFLLLTNIFLWAVGPLFIKYFAGYYDVWTQNAFRYSTAAAMLLLLAALRRGPSLRLTRSQWKKLLLVAAANITLQVAFASSYYYIYPSVASLVMRVDILFVCLLSLIFFHDERQIVRLPSFLVGAGLAVLGLIAVLSGQDPDLLERLDVAKSDFWIGISLVITYAFFLAVYALGIKRLVRDVHPITSFTHVSWITALGLTLLMLLFGDPSALWRGPPEPLLLMVLTALCCIIIAHTALYAALREIKAVVSTTLTQLTPVFTCAFSALIYRDSLSGVQIVGGLAVLTGAWLAGMAQVRVARQAARAERAKQAVEG